MYLYLSKHVFQYTYIYNVYTGFPGPARGRGGGAGEYFELEGLMAVYLEQPSLRVEVGF